MLPDGGSRRARISIGVIVVNWRNAPDTIECLDSLASADPKPFRVVVIDNGSDDISVEQLVQWSDRNAVPFELLEPEGLERFAEGCGRDSPWLTIVRLAGNRGFAGGNNVGLALLEADDRATHFLLLNNDAVVAPDYFAQMELVLAEHPHTGLCIGTIYEFSDRRRVWYAGGRMRPLRALATHNLRLPAASDPMRTDFVTGCAMVISRGAIARVGMLAECYFPGYMEDAEYSLRVNASGLDLFYAPLALVYHKGGATFGARATSTLTAYHQNKHRLFFVRRNLRGASRLAAMGYMILTKPGRALIDVLQGRRYIGWATLRGTWDGLTTRIPDVPPSRRQARFDLAGDHAAR